MEFRVRKWLGGSGLGVDLVLDSGRNEFLGSLMYCCSGGLLRGLTACTVRMWLE